MVEPSIPVQTQQPTPEQYCDHMAAFARAVMQQRQRGVPVEEVFKQATTDGEKAIVLQAFERPAYFSPSFQRNEIDNLSTSAFIDCRRAIQGE